MAAEDFVLILGAARSGTTWLATIFDSHEDTLYRHEPDMVDRTLNFPSPCPATAIPLHRDVAREYLIDLARSRAARCAAKSPAFHKTYRSACAGMFRRGYAGTLSIASQFCSTFDRASVPDLVSRNGNVRLVMKSASRCGNAGLYATAMPEAKIIFIVRSPMGQIASMLRGTELGKLDAHTATNGLCAWNTAKNYGLTEAAFGRMSILEKLAWHWVILNQTALVDLHGLNNAYVACYDDVCKRTESQIEKIFAFAKLRVGEQTRRFIKKSTAIDRSSRYYSVYRLPDYAETSWKKYLSDADQRRITNIVRQSPVLDFVRALVPNDESWAAL